MTSNMIHLTAAAYQAELRRAATEHNRHQVDRVSRNGLRLPHGLMQKLQAKVARPAPKHITVPRVSL